MLSALLKTATTETPDIAKVSSSQIALNILEMERGLGDELKKLKGARLALVDQLQKSQAEEERAELARKLNGLDEQTEKTYRSAFDHATYDLLILTKRKLDKVIERKNQIEIESMEKEASRFQRIVVSFESSTDFPLLPPIKRIMRPVLVFSELQALAENFYPGFNVVLMKPGTVEIVGSQDELFFAYHDASDGQVLDLELKITSASLKRKADDESDATPELRHEGPWSNAEMELFKMGVDQFGWKKWKSISRVIGTRDRQQVRQFSSTPKGAYTISDSYRFTLQENA